jgi:TPR repeat protein
MRLLRGKNAYLALVRLLGLVALSALMSACFPKTDQAVFSNEDLTPFERDAFYAVKMSATDSNPGAEGLSFRFTAVDGKDFMVESYTTSKDGKLDAALFIGRLVEVAPGWRVLELGDRIGASQRIYVLTRWDNGGFSAYAPLENKTMSAIAARHGITLSAPKLNDAGTFSGSFSPAAFKAMFADAAAHIERGTTPKPAMKLDYVSMPDLPGGIAAQGRRKAFETLSGAFPILLRAAEPGHQQLMRRFMENLAQAGDPWGSYFLARIYGNGAGVPLDWAKAESYAEQAVAQGNERAKLILGYILRNGESPTAADQDRAFQLLTDAANAGDGTAMTNLATMHLDPKDPRHDEKKGYSWQERAAAAGEVNALYMVALRLRDGVGTQKSEADAFKAMTVAAQLFHPDALAELGRMYEKGQGTSADDALAIAQYRQAARLGNAWAQWQLGDRLLNGRGVPANEGEGKAWLEKAAANGSAEAAEPLKRPSSPDMDELMTKANDFFDQEISKLDKDIDKLGQEIICLEVGDRCKLNRNGKALLRLRHAQGWYFADGTVAEQSDWPQ